MTGWTDETRANCADWCACYGDVPCYKIGVHEPCADCIAGRANPDWGGQSEHHKEGGE